MILINKKILLKLKIYNKFETNKKDILYKKIKKLIFNKKIL